MKISIKPILWVNKADKDGRCPIALSIAGSGKRTYYNTGIKVLPDFYQDDKIIKGEENHDIKNANLQNLITSAKREILNLELQGEAITIDAVKSLLNPTTRTANGADFYKVAELAIKRDKPQTQKRYTVELEKLKTYAPKLTFGAITADWLTGYYKYLTTKTGKEWANNHNTAINAFKVIRMTFNYAREEKITKLYPFADWKYPTYRQPVKEYLEMVECEKIYKLLGDASVDPAVKKVAAFFLVECWAGLRVSDWGKFTIEHTGEQIDMILPVDLMPSLRKVVEYIEANKLKWTETGEYARLQLKLVRSMAGISKHLNTHIGRHTYATHQLAIGVSTEGLAQAMGISHRQVSTYAKLVPTKLRQELQRIGGGL